MNFKTEKFLNVKTHSYVPKSLMSREIIHKSSQLGESGLCFGGTLWHIVAHCGEGVGKATPTVVKPSTG
jgi:hypothetical protein